MLFCKIRQVLCTCICALHIYSVKNDRVVIIFILVILSHPLKETDHLFGIVKGIVQSAHKLCQIRFLLVDRVVDPYAFSHGYLKCDAVAGSFFDHFFEEIQLGNLELSVSVGRFADTDHPDVRRDLKFIKSHGNIFYSPDMSFR